MVRNQNRVRELQSMREGLDYLFTLDTDGPRPFYRVYNPATAETYELDNGDCSCPDYQLRLKPAEWSGCRCKHMIEMQRRIRTGELPSLADKQLRLPLGAWAGV